jgi:hypothetical protein
MQLKPNDISQADYWWKAYAPGWAVPTGLWKLPSHEQNAVKDEVISWLGTEYIAKGQVFHIAGWLYRARVYKVLLRIPGTDYYIHTSPDAIIRFKTNNAPDFMAWLRAKTVAPAPPPVDVDEAPRTALNIAHSVLIKLGCTGYPAPGNYESYIERFDLKTEHPGNTVCYRDDCVVCREIRREVDEHGGQSDIGPAIAQAWAADYSARIKDNARA